jgi:uncharacterized protein YkwD
VMEELERVKAFLNKRIAVVAMTVVIALGLSSCGFANTSSAGPSDPYTAALFNSLNLDRVGNGLPPLTWSPKLANQAGSWAQQMADAAWLHHQDLSALINSPDYAAYSTLGENILTGQGSMTPQSIEGAWMASPPHRANILSSAFNIVGIGYVRGLDGRIWAVQDFGGI